MPLRIPIYLYKSMRNIWHFLIFPKLYFYTFQLTTSKKMQRNLPVIIEIVVNGVKCIWLKSIENTNVFDPTRYLSFRNVAWRQVGDWYFNCLHVVSSPFALNFSRYIRQPSSPKTFTLPFLRSHGQTSEPHLVEIVLITKM